MLASWWAMAQPGWADDTAESANASWHQKTAIDVEPAVEFWVGVESYHTVRSLYAGATWAPFSNLRQDGFRLRAIGGGSNFRYAGVRLDPADETTSLQQFAGAARFGDVLAGWQWSKDTLTLKAFGGLQWELHKISPYDPLTRVQGRAFGPIGSIEAWNNWTPLLWTSLDLAGTRAFTSYNVLLRTGYRLDEAWAVGPEASLIGHSETQLRRYGAFLRHETLADEATMSGGISETRHGDRTFYLSGQYLRRF